MKTVEIPADLLAKAQLVAQLPSLTGHRGFIRRVIVKQQATEYELARLKQIVERYWYVAQKREAHKASKVQYDAQKTGHDEATATESGDEPGEQQPKAKRKRTNQSESEAE